MEKYQEHDVLPAFEKAVFGDGGKPLPSSSGLLRWSGANPPPDIGAFVQIKLNGIGPARVVGYFTEGGWFGLIVKPLDPPKWFVDEKGYDVIGHAFGVDIQPELIPEPVVKGPSQEQLAALQRFADRVGRGWKLELSLAWSTGADEREDDACFLRQVRNDFGPTWLHSRRNPIKLRGSRKHRR